MGNQCLGNSEAKTSGSVEEYWGCSPGWGRIAPMIVLHKAPLGSSCVQGGGGVKRARGLSMLGRQGRA